MGIVLKSSLPNINLSEMYRVVFMITITTVSQKWYSQYFLCTWKTSSYKGANIRHIRHLIYDMREEICSGLVYRRWEESYCTNCPCRTWLSVLTPHKKRLTILFCPSLLSLSFIPMNPISFLSLIWFFHIYCCPFLWQMYMWHRLHRWWLFLTYLPIWSILVRSGNSCRHRTRTFWMLQ